MNTKFTQAFKQQAVEKVLRRGQGVSFRAVASQLGVSHSSLYQWVVASKDSTFGASLEGESEMKSHEKKPQDWSLEERFQMIVACASLDKEAISQHCRERGLYPHHIEQWKRDFIHPPLQNTKADAIELKKLKLEYSATKKELHRKTRALAETAALLVLQKKVNALWDNDEEDSQ